MSGIQTHHLYLWDSSRKCVCPASGILAMQGHILN